MSDESQPPEDGMLTQPQLLGRITAAIAEHPQEEHFVVCLRPTEAAMLDCFDVATAATLRTSLIERVGACLSEDQAFSRGDCGTILVYGRGDLRAARQVAVRISRSVNDSGHLAEFVSFAAGITSYPEHLPDPLDATSLVRQASLAQRSVASVGGAVAEFVPSMQLQQSYRLRVRQLVANRLHLDPAKVVEARFAPVVNLETGKVTGVTVHGAWKGGGHLDISPDELAETAEAVGAAQQLDELVLCDAITAFGDWMYRWPDVCKRMWVGIRRMSLAAPGLPERVAGWLTDARLAGTSVVLLVTDETPLAGLGADEIRENIGMLRRMGIRLARRDALATAGQPAGAEIVDDPVGEADYFGIAPALVARCTSDPRSRHLVQATVDYAASMGAVSVARQVGTGEQHEQLYQLGVMYGFGPLYGAPRPKLEVETLLAEADTGEQSPPVRQALQRRHSSRAWQELRHVIGGLPVAAFACDRDARVLLAEGALFNQLGLPSDRLDRPLATLIAEVNQSTGRSPLDGPLRQALRGSATVTTVPAGSRLLQVHLCPSRDRDNPRQINGVLGVAIDVTHRHQAELALRDSERRFRDVFDQAPVGMAVMASNTRVIEVNPVLASMLGYSPQDMVGRKMDSFWHAESPVNASDQYAGLRKGKVKSYRGERTYQHRDGSPVNVRVTVSAITDAGMSGTALIIVEDLRELRHLEVELRHAQKLEAVGMLAAGIAHEINTPIQFIGDNINFLSDAFDQLSQVLVGVEGLLSGEQMAEVTNSIDLPWLLEEVPTAAQQSLDGVERVATIVRAMRNFGHPDQRHPTPIDVNAAIKDTATIARNEHKYVADLTVELGDVPPILGFPSEFHQVVLNLIVNAAHAVGSAIEGTGGRGSIHVRSWADASAVHVSVRDDGCGMSPEVRNRIFDPFFTTKEVGRGTGQGLTIVHTVVEKHNGTVTVDTAPGEGSTFTIHLPLDSVTGNELPAAGSGANGLAVTGPGANGLAVAGPGANGLAAAGPGANSLAAAGAGGDIRS